MRKARPAVFLDRDGTLIYDRPGHYLSSPDRLRMYPYTPKALRLLQDKGFALVVISNQSGVGRGYLNEDTLERINEKLKRLLALKGIKVDGIYSCLHRPEDRCRCRKPKTLLALQAVRECRLTLKGSFVVGDKKADVDLARNLKLPAVFLLTGHGRNEVARYGRRIRAAFKARNLLLGARWITHPRKTG